MDTKEIAAIVVSTVTIVASIIGWIEVQHEKLATKIDLQTVQSSVDDIEERQENLATKDDLIYINLGINDIRLRNFERQGVETLDDTDRRIYDGLVASTKELERQLKE